MTIFINGQFVSETQAAIPVSDRGFMYGDGLFETVRVCAGRPFRMEQHLERMTAGLIIRISYYQIALTPLKSLVLGDYFKAEAGENETGGVASLTCGGSYGRKTNGTSVAKTSPIRHEGAGLPPPCKPIP